MKVLLVSNYLYDRQESMLRFADALAEGLRAAGVEVQLVRPEPFIGRIHPGYSGIGKWLGYLDKFRFFPPRLRQFASTVDVVHICDHSNAMYVNQIANRPHLVTCNDMLAIRSAKGEFPQNPTGWSGRILQRWILTGLRRAHRLTCISAATRCDVLRLTGHKPEAVSVTYMGQNFPYAPVPRLNSASTPYILHVGGAQWYKNRPGVLAIHAALRARLGQRTPRLVLVGPPCDAAGVEVRSNVDNATLAALYSGAELLLFPSLEEGFGWPIIEAQACGCRVVTTAKDPMMEVGGRAAYYLQDPTDAVAGAALIETLLAQDPASRAEAVHAGIENAARFSTERMVHEYLAIYREVLGA
jgi:glycosyltransferase involved in cell wall biosynthesis